MVERHTEALLVGEGGMGGEERGQKIEDNKLDTGYREGAGEERGESHLVELPGRVGLGLGDREVTQTGASPTQHLDHLNLDVLPQPLVRPAGGSL